MPALLFPARRRRGGRPVRDVLSAEALEQRLALAAFTLNLQNWTGFQASEAELYVVGYSGVGPIVNPGAGLNMYLDASTNGTFASNFFTKTSLTPVKISDIGNKITIDQSVTVAGGQLVFFLTPTGVSAPAITVNQPGANTGAGGPVGASPGATTYDNSPLPPRDIVELTQITGSGANTGLTIDLSAVSQWGMPIQLNSQQADQNSQTKVGATMPATQSTSPPPFFREDLVTAFNTFMSNANGSPGRYSGGSAFTGLPFGTATIGGGSHTFGIESPDNALSSGAPDPGPSAPLQLATYFDESLDTFFSAATGTVKITNLPAETNPSGQSYAEAYNGEFRSDSHGAYFEFSPQGTYEDPSTFRIYSPRSTLFNTVNPSWQVFSNPGNGAFLTPYDASGHPIPVGTPFWKAVSQAGNQINMALNRGVVNLPNAGTATWSDQTKWYQASQRSNLHAAFFHSATVHGLNTGVPFMLPPTPSITLGNGFTGLGAYTFSLDENPPGTVQAQVPPKLNNIANGGNVTIDVTFGPWRSESTVSVNAPQTFAVVENSQNSPFQWPASPVPFADTAATALTVTLSVSGGTIALDQQAASKIGLTVGTSPQGPTPGAPTVTLTPGVFTTAVNTPVGLLFTGTPFADTGATPTTVFTVTMSTGGPANGNLAAAAGSGVTVVTSGAGATFTGTLSALNAYFTTAPAKITYSPPANVQGTRTLSTVIAVDGKASQPAITTILIGTNAAPTVAAPIAFWVPEQGRMNLVWPRGLQPFSDRDSRLLTVTLSTGSPASVGSFAASRADRTVTVVTTGDVVQLTGRPADLNRYFATAGRITYTAIGPSLQPRVLTVRASDGGAAGAAESAILVRARGPVGVPAINRSASLGSTPAGTPLVIAYAQLVAATGATAANSRSVEFLLGGVSSGRLELWDGAKWIRVPAVLPKFKEPILAPGGQIRWTPPARATGQRAAFRAIAWDGWKMSAIQSQVSVDVT